VIIRKAEVRPGRRSSACMCLWALLMSSGFLPCNLKFSRHNTIPWIGDYGGRGPGRPPFWRTPEEYRKGLGSVTSKINTQHTRCVCLLLQYLLQSCSRGGRGKVEDSGLWSGDLHGKRYHRIELFDPRGFPCNYSTMVKTALSQWQRATGPNVLGNPG
jgi:hypothetical protein